MALSPNSSSLQSADLSTLLRINKRFPFHITYKGNDAVVYQHALANYFSHNPVTWKRNGKFFPHPLIFPIKFVPFDDKHVFTFDSTIEDFKSFAFLHIFFINASSADEYRNNIRHTVSEWFAGLSSRPELQWLIVVDTTRAKEKKNRSNLMDKIKTDFSKHHHKLVEVCDSVEHNSFSTLTGLVQSSLLSHLELLTETWERCLKMGRERHVAKDWSLVECVNQEVDYARLFWSMGALDHSLKLYEDLDSFIFFLLVSITESESGSYPPWADRLGKEEMEECPTLLESMREVEITKGTTTIAGIRHLLLSHKLLLTLHLYNSKVHSNKATASPGTRCDYAAVVMKYASNTLHGVVEHLLVLKSWMSSARLSCWVVQLVGEALYLACLIADVNTVEIAKEAVAAMHTKRFKEKYELQLLSLTELGVEEREGLLQWMEGVIRKRESEEKLTKSHRDSALSLLVDALRSPSSLEMTMLRTHDAASSFLTQSGRRRTAAAIGYQLALALTRLGKPAAALPYYLRFVSSLMENGERAESMLRVIDEALSKLHPKEDYERMVRFLLYLVHNTRDEEKRREWATRLKSELERGKRESLHPIRLTEWTEHCGCPCRVRVSQKTETTKIVPGEKLSVGVHISSSIPSFSLEGVEVRVRLSPLSHSTATNHKPAFDVEYRLAESRLICVNGGWKKGSPSISPRDEEAIELAHEGIIDKIDNEGTTIQMEAVVKKTGIFMLNCVELAVCSGALSMVIPQSGITIDKKMMMAIVEERKHSVAFPQGRVLESGVSECLRVSLSSGSLAIPASTLRVTIEEGEEGDIEFMSEDGLWESLVVLSVPSLEKDQKVEREIRLCMPLSGEVKGEEEMRKIRLEWSGRTFLHIVRFAPLFSTRFTNSHLESKMLLDLEIARPASSLWSILPLESSLTIKNSIASIELSLMYFDSQPVDPRGISSFTWLAAPLIDGPPIVPFTLRLRYRVSPMEEREMEEGVDREYEYRLEGDLELKRVQYEVCSQVLSQQPGAQLCRVGTPCHLLVSIRALSIHETDSLVVTVVTDERLWEVGERSKAVTLKESGLGQVYLLVIPLVAGFLPFPSVQIHAAAPSIRSEDRFWSDSSDSVPVPPLFTFERTAGKQIRVLGASGGDGGSVSSRGEKRTIKEKLQKLFD
ncbi:hypothetical protein PMAYCL1PPCAC_24177 [Pristionchus mayeri]|uniref:Uncharacterized protein n=1 Tax=Pristionchus mayeri TaxID=1317129 RepID=A0AAN5I686_9BILA|nr:hypothetical protein PMAYCL1PPCAC_24177 [Pristionchus mayeri]